MIKILVNGEWVEGSPKVGQVYRKIFIDSKGNEGYIESVHESSVPEPIRRITKRAFMKRFTQAERIAIRASTDPIVVDIYEDLKLATFVDLDDVDVVNAIDYLVSIGLLESTRKSKMLIDGTDNEKI